MNRAQRRAAARKPATLPDKARHLATQTFQDRISWTAAATILVRVIRDPAFKQLDDGLKGGIVRFLERNPPPDVALASVPEVEHPSE